MRTFYKQVFMDDAEDGRLRFYGECPCCGKRHYGRKLPLLCRIFSQPGLLVQGRGGWLPQQLYNRSRALAVQDLARHFNLCHCCGNWVCDDCYDSQAADGICTECIEKRKE